MLEDYRVYLTNVRNNLIQCGVEFPINPLDTYSELFYLGLQLDEVLWYYHILAVSGSEEALVGCMFPLRGYYKEKMRQVFYNEFREFLPDYKKISTMYTLLQGYTSITQNEEISDNEELNLFDNTEKEEQITNEVEEVRQKTLSPNAFLSMINGVKEYDNEEDKEEIVEEDYVPMEEYQTEEYSSHDTYLDDIESDSEEYASHGVYLDEIEKEESSRVEDTEEYATHGVYLDEIDTESSENNGVLIDDDDFEIAKENIYNEEEDDNYYEDEEVIEGEASKVRYDEDGFEIVDEVENYNEDEEDYEEEYEEEKTGGEADNIIYDDDGFEIVNESESYSEEEDEEYDDYEDEDENNGIKYDENGFEIVDEEDNYNEEEYEDEYDDEEDTSQSSNNEIEYKRITTESSPKEVVSPSVKATKEKDISDYLQDAVNATLTKGKRFIYKEVKKMKDT